MGQRLKIPSPSCVATPSQGAELVSSESDVVGVWIAFLVLKGKYPRGLRWLKHHHKFESRRPRHSGGEVQRDELITQSFKLNYP